MPQLTDSFDPHYKWLGIAPEEQPVDHYRLLGVRLLEADVDVIASAADRQMAHVKSFASGRHAAHSQQLLNELSKARVCLLNAEMKRIYDNQLRRRDSAQQVGPPLSSPTPPPVVSHLPPSPEGPAVPQGFAARRRSPKKARPKRSLFRALVLNALILGVAGVAAILLLDQLQKAGPNASTLKDKVQSEAIEKRGSSDASKARSATPKAAPNRPSNAPASRFAQDPPDLPKPFPNPERERPLIARVPVPQAFELPNVLPLPALTGVPGVLCSLPRSPSEAVIDLQLLTPDWMRDLRRTPWLFRRDKAPDDHRWYVYDIPPRDRVNVINGSANSPDPIAVLQCAEGKLSFVWQEGEKEEDRQRLYCCLLEVSISGRSHVAQLIEPVVDRQPIEIGDWRELHNEVVHLDRLPVSPPATALRVCLLTGPKVPSTRSQKGDRDALLQDDQLTLAFDTPGAGLCAFFQTGGSRLRFNVAPGFELQSEPDEIRVLSPSELAATRKKYERLRERTEADLRRCQRTQGRLSSELKAAQSINTRSPGGGRIVAQEKLKQQRVADASQKLAANQQRLSMLSKRSQVLSSDLSIRVPALQQLAAELLGCHIGFEIYLPAGAHRVVLYRKGQTLAAADDRL